MSEPIDIRQLNAQIEAETGFITDLVEGMNRTIVGQKHLINSLLIGLLADGHILLEGVPGLAKTLAIKTLASLISADFGRLQFTPDLLPADVIGTMIYSQKDESFKVKKGPIFANFVLADEINRAPAKVQSALLEAMQERQVTIGDETFNLPSPFLVMATQNPIEQEGTYELPEAQVDRFMLKVIIDYPTLQEEKKIVRAHLNDSFDKVLPVIDTNRIVKARELVKQVYIDERIEQYIADIVFATRYPEQYKLNEMKNYISFGGSPRASINLALAARANAFIKRRGYVVPEDVRSVAYDVLRHRIRSGGCKHQSRRYCKRNSQQGRGALNFSLMETSELLSRVRRIEIKTRALTNNIFAGEYHSAFKGRGMSFAEVREYQPGDDIRDIDWNVTARMNRPYIKIYEEERELTVMLLIDLSASQMFGTRQRSQRDLATEIAATLAFSAMQNNDKIGVIFFTDRIEKFIPPQKGRKHVLYIIRELLNFQPQNKRTNLGVALEYLVRIMSKRTITFLISDFLASNDFTKQLSIAARKHDVVALQVYDRCMAQLPNVGLIKVTDAETGHEQYIDTSSTEVRLHQQKWWHLQKAKLTNVCQKSKVDYTSIATDTDFVKPLMNLLSQR